MLLNSIDIYVWHYKSDLGLRQYQPSNSNYGNFLLNKGLQNEKFGAESKISILKTMDLVKNRPDLAFITFFPITKTVP